MRAKLYYTITFLIFLVTSCQTGSKKIDLQQLNGYWEIESVTTNDNKVKQYKINTTVEYFQLDENLKGFRKKAMADFSGKYKSNNRKDSISIKKEGDNYYLNTNTQVHSQKEKIIELTAQKLLLENETGYKYLFKRHQKIDLN